GWQDEGEWPPKTSGVLDRGSKLQKNSGNGVGSRKGSLKEKMKGLRVSGDSGQGGGGEGEGMARRSVGKVKRALGR
ncbi:MAG: hypothetical protein Q9174_003159, partial [Haloplaca sp. 1 TL-2023]